VQFVYRNFAGEMLGIPHAFDDPVQGAMGQPHRNIGLTRKIEYAANMIIMFMGHQDGAKVLRLKAEPLQPTLTVFQGKATIHQQASIT